MLQMKNDHAAPARTPGGRLVPYRSRAAGFLATRWYGIALAVLALGTVGAYLLNLAANGWANAFYSAAVQAGSQSWEAFLFGSSDAANAITVDKPPAALWLMELSVRLFGLGSVQILAPQVILAGLTVLMLARSVRVALEARAGTAPARWAALGAGLIFALSPVAALMFRFNNPDALLVALMAAAVLATQQAVRAQLARADAGRAESARTEPANPELRAAGSRRAPLVRRALGTPALWLVLAGVALGLGFLTKQLQVLLIAPGLVAAWLVAAR